MSKDIRIKKGLDIKLIGDAEKVTENAVVSNFYSIRPEDFHSITPKLVIKVGSRVKAGEALFYNKDNEAMKFVSPVSGEVTEVERGARRRIEAIKITADKAQTYLEHGKFDLASDAEKTKAHLLASGCWAFIKQRPYDVVAN